MAAPGPCESGKAGGEAAPSCENCRLFAGPALAPSSRGEVNPLTFHPSNTALAVVQGRLKGKAGEKGDHAVVGAGGGWESARCQAVEATLDAREGSGGSAGGLCTDTEGGWCAEVSRG